MKANTALSLSIVRHIRGQIVNQSYLDKIIIERRRNLTYTALSSTIATDEGSIADRVIFCFLGA